MRPIALKKQLTSHVNVTPRPLLWSSIQKGWLIIDRSLLTELSGRFMGVDYYLIAMSTLSTMSFMFSIPQAILLTIYP